MVYATTQCHITAVCANREQEVAPHPVLDVTSHYGRAHKTCALQHLEARAYSPGSALKHTVRLIYALHARERDAVNRKVAIVNQDASTGAS